MYICLLRLFIFICCLSILLYKRRPIVSTRGYAISFPSTPQIYRVFPGVFLRIYQPDLDYMRHGPVRHPPQATSHRLQPGMTEETIGQDRQSTVVRVRRGLRSQCGSLSPHILRRVCRVSSQLTVMSGQEFSSRACSLYRTAMPIWHTKYVTEKPFQG